MPFKSWLRLRQNSISTSGPARCPRSQQSCLFSTFATWRVQYISVVSSRCTRCLSRAASLAVLPQFSSSEGMYSTVRPCASCTTSVRDDMKRCV